MKNAILTMLLLCVPVLTLPVHMVNHSPAGTANPCTGFVVKSDNVLYGMNFDYPDVDIKISIRNINDRKVFIMAFKQAENLYIPVVGMNDLGLFGNLQMLLPAEELTANPEPGQISTLKLLNDALNNFGTVAEVIDYIADKKVVHANVTLHSLFADPTGDGVIVEAGKDCNLTSGIKDKFLVMTNFPVCNFNEKKYTEVEGVGADRYITVYENIQRNISSFNRDKAFETLEKTKLESDGFKTQCSLVFNPEEGNIYLSVRRDFSKIWKIDLDEQTIETFKGFDENKLIDLDETGIIISETLMPVDLMD